MLPRRTPLKRTGNLKRTAMKRKPAKRHRLSDTRADIQAWREQHESCACCWVHQRRFGVSMHTHHVVGGNRSRPDCTWNVIRLCSRCHEWIHTLKNRVAVGMGLKLSSDRENYSRSAMSEWYGRFGTEKVPRAARLPAIVWEWRRENGFYPEERFGLNGHAC